MDTKEEIRVNRNFNNIVKSHSEAKDIVKSLIDLKNNLNELPHYIIHSYCYANIIIAIERDLKELTPVLEKQGLKIDCFDCKTGYCCQQFVSTFDFEAREIAEKIVKQDIEFDLEELKAQTDLKNDQMVKRKCVFFKNNKCSIYEFRPIACRKHFSSPLEPKYACKVTDKVINEPILINTEIFYNGIANSKYGKRSSLAAGILKYLK